MFDIGPGNIVVLKDKAILLVKEFKTIWNSDKSKSKEIALKEFAYIYLKNDFKSSYRNAYVKAELVDKLKEDLSLSSDWEPSKDVLLAEKKYNDLQITKSLKALISAETALEQVITYFNDFDVTKIDEERRSGAIKQLMDNIKSIDETVGKLESAKKRIERELSSKNLSGTKQLTSRELPKSKRKV
jgi:hypothetical protein